MDNTKWNSSLKQSACTPLSSEEGKLWVDLFQEYPLLNPNPLLKKKLCVREGWSMCAWVKLSAGNSWGLELQECGHWEQKPHLLQEQGMLLTAEPRLQSL